MALTQTQIDELVDAVRQAGLQDVMPRFRGLHSGEVEAKSNALDLVTIADHAAEESLRESVSKILPGAAFVGEEAVAADPRVLERIGTSETCIVVDPIDGTGNYVAGLAVFGTILAVIHKGETIFGLLYDPVLDDWMFAIRGEGGWFRRRDGLIKRLRTNDDRELATARGFLSIEEYPEGERMALRRAFGSVLHVRDIRCSCHEYRLLASGSVDFLRSYSLKPWDHAAGVLLLEEAGGWAAVNGVEGYLPTLQEGRMVAASCQAMGQRVVQLAKGMP